MEEGLLFSGVRHAGLLADAIVAEQTPLGGIEGAALAAAVFTEEEGRRLIELKLDRFAETAEPLNFETARNEHGIDLQGVRGVGEVR